jgi:hypothetical protein
MAALIRFFGLTYAIAWLLWLGRGDWLAGICAAACPGGQARACLCRQRFACFVDYDPVSVGCRAVFLGKDEEADSPGTRE